MKDITGVRFGRLVAQRPVEERKHSSIVWECLCDCGNIVNVRRDHLTGQHTQSCGCARNGGQNRPAKDLSGLTFGKLTVIRKTGERKNGQWLWECRCDCGKTVNIRSSGLISGQSRSCGCEKGKLQTDLTGQIFGHLTVKRMTGDRKNGYYVWECGCDCGNTIAVSGRYLMTGATQDCGCQKKTDSKTQ